MGGLGRGAGPEGEVLDHCDHTVFGHRRERGDDQGDGRLPLPGGDVGTVSGEIHGADHGRIDVSGCEQPERVPQGGQPRECPGGDRVGGAL